MAQIQYFLKAAELLNFTAAAKAMFVSQPALSKQIALLEEEIGTRLFVRKTREVELTPAGAALRQDLTAVMRQLEDAKKRAREIGKRENHNITIYCFDGKMSSDFLPDVLGRLRQADPDIRAPLILGGFEENKQALKSGKADLLLTLDRDFPETLDGEEFERSKILRREGVLIFAKNSLLGRKENLKAEDFCAFPLIMTQRQHSEYMNDTTMNDLRRNGIVPPQIIEAENSVTMYARLQMGEGYSLLGEKMTAADPAMDSFALKDMETWVVAIWKKDSPKASLLRNAFRFPGL